MAGSFASVIGVPLGRYGISETTGKNNTAHPSTGTVNGRVDGGQEIRLGTLLV